MMEGHDPRRTPRYTLGENFEVNNAIDLKGKIYYIMMRFSIRKSDRVG